MINIDKIFNLFGSTPSQSPSPNPKINYKQTPGFWINMVIKLYKNNQIIVETLLNNLPQIHSDEIDILNENLIKSHYHSITSYLLKIDTNDQMHVDCIKVFSNKSLYNACENTIRYWEVLEKYEICGKIKKIQNIVEDNLM
jgi:hypothetical protein